jgi:hypothetical protein
MSGNPTPDLLEWARNEAKLLRQDAPGVQYHAVFGRPRAAAALDFLRRHASGTNFLCAAEGTFDKGVAMQGSDALMRMAEILESWAKFVEDGMAAVQPFSVQARIEAATDLMEQVQQLISDSKVHPAAPIVLAGAALEEFLRSRVTASNVQVKGKPGINSYAQALQAGGSLSAQDVKDITAWAGQRNEAAHGEFAKLSPERAQIMIDGINLFMRQKASNA